ncbi:hypothetical protein D3C80_1938260 [compost metagenome]
MTMVGAETPPSAGRHSRHWPRIFIRPSSVFSTDFAAAAPTRSTALGCIRTKARSRKGAQAACSCGVGRRLPGGFQKTVLVMKA